jgi:hypothetical protein
VTTRLSPRSTGSSVSVVAATGLLIVVLEAVRRRRLLERYALLWLLSAIVLLVLAVWRNLLEVLARWVGIASPPNALFFVAFGFVLVLLLHFSLVVSRLTDQSKVLAQRLALLEERVDGRRDEQGHLVPTDELAEQSESRALERISGR